MRPSVRFLELELTYGCHVGRRFRFDGGDGPWVVCGPNGTGKSTLLEALVRTVFGFNRRLQEEREREELRAPWREPEFTARLVLAGPEGRWELRRDFRTERAELRPLDGEGEAWAGDANPASTNDEARSYRRRVRSLLGFARREPYERTACVHQGELARTRLDRELLQVASGGHGEVDRALDDLRERHREVTREPLEEDDRPGRVERALERARREAADLRERLAEAEAAVRRRRPLRARIEALEERRGTLRRELTALDAALEPLAATRAAEAEGRAARTARRVARRALEGLREAARRREAALEAAGAARAELPGALEAYPDDFPERLARLEAAWRQRDEAAAEAARRRAELEATASPGPLRAAAGLALACAGAAGAAGFLVGAETAGGLAALALALVALVGSGAAALGWRRRRARLAAAAEAARAAEGALERLEAEAGELLAGVPEAEALGPQSAAARRAAYRRARRAREEREAAEAALEGGVERAREAAAEAAAALEEETPALLAAAEAAEGAAAAAEGDGPVDAEPWLDLLDGLVDRLQTREARMGLERDRAEPGSLALPEDVAAEADAVREARRERRAEIERLGEELEALRAELLERGAPAESPVALRERLERAEAEVARREREAEVRARAYALVRDAYRAFRERDQERLAGHVSRRLEELSGGALGPLELGGGLEEARVRAGGRAVALATPPLSHGEFHAVLLGIRLGATDFLASAGIRPPLIVDDPFVHLDERRAAEVWRVLERAAADRQVVVATQDRLLLEHLGVRPDLELGD